MSVRLEGPELPDLVEHRMAQVGWELRAEMARLELRMTKWVFIGAIATVALVVSIAMPEPKGAALLLFLAGTAAQTYAVFRM